MQDFDAIASAKKTIKCEIDGLEALGKSIDNNFVKAVDVMAKVTGRVIVTGMGKSGHIARKIAATMASTGTPAFFVHPAEASHGDLGMLTDKDVVIAISKSGESKELSDILQYCKRFGITLIGMACVAESSLMQRSDIRLLIPNMPEACPLGVAPTTSTTATIALGDALAMALLEQKHFSKDQFKDRHPGGKLGQSLLKVSDLMHSGDKVPLVGIKDSVAKMLDVMSEKSLGCIGITDDSGELLGIVTDGDLRRKMSNNFLDRKLEDIMVANPKTIDKDSLVVEATAFMNSKKITNLFVVENKKPIGVIHIHDCLRAGVV